MEAAFHVTHYAQNIHFAGNGIVDREECDVFLPTFPNYVPLPKDRWRQREGKHEVEEEKEVKYIAILIVYWFSI